MPFRSVLRPEGSIVAGLTVMALVYADYQLNIGSVAQAHATDSNHPVLETSRKKAGYSALILVGGIGLIAKDANIIILGAATIIGMELMFRHAIMAHPGTGEMQAPGSNVYGPAQNVVPMYQQAEAGY